jgi:hypothetical protein
VRESGSTSPAGLGIDIGKNSFHIVGLDQRGAIVLRASRVVEAEAELRALNSDHKLRNLQNYVPPSSRRVPA